MKRKYLLYFISFLLVVASIIIYRIVIYKSKQISNEISEYRKKIASVDSGFDKKINMLNTGESVSKANTGEFFVISGNFLNVNLSGENKKDLLKKIKQFYFQSLIQGDLIGQTQALVYLYNLTKDKKLLPIIASKYEKQFLFDKAILYRKQYYSSGFDKVDTFTFKKILYALVNSEQFFDKNTIEKLVLAGYKKKLISSEDKIFYDSIFEAVDLNITGFLNLVNSLSGYQIFKKLINQDYLIYKQYRDVPKYYFWALVAKDLFNQGFIGPAKFISLKILSYNSNYILPNQILAYSYFLQNDLRAKYYLKKLIDLDSDNQDRYKFLLGVLNYWIGKPSDTIIYLYDLPKDFQYADFAKRYMFLAYYKLGDYEKSFEIFKNLARERLSSYDRRTFFYLFLFNQNRKIKSLIDANQKFVIKSILKCYKDLSPTLYYVCRYGKGLYYLHIGERNKAFKYIKYLIRYYPEPQFFAFLGKWYENKGDYKKAEKYYLLGLKYSIENKYVKFFRQKILDLISETLKKNIEK